MRGVPGWIRVTVSVWTCAALLLLSACSQNRGDPGNRRLKALQSDPALALVAPGARLVGESSREAWTPPFSKSFDGPSTIRSYVLSTPREEVRSFYKAELPRFGWRFERSEALGPDREVLIYRKNFGNWEALLTIGDASDGELSVHADAPPAERGK